MNILAINTTNKLAEVVCKTKNGTKSSPVNGMFSEFLMPSIDDILQQCNIDVSEVDTFGLVTGPGSFTGIRIGMAVIKGMMCGGNTKCVAVNSFELLSYNIISQDYVVLLDSGNKEPYYAIYTNKKLVETGFGSYEKIKEYAQKNCVEVFYSSEEQACFKDFDFATCIKVKPDTLINLVEEKANNNQFTNIKELSPLYIKMSQAEIGLEQDIKQNVSYRFASMKDANSLAIIDEQIFDGSEMYNEQSFASDLQNSDKIYYVAVHKNLVVGYVLLAVVGDDLELHKIAVLPQFRKLGIGKNLLDMASKYMKKNHYKKLFLEVRETNKNAINLYNKFGFKVLSKRENYYDDGEACLVMQLE